MNSVIWQTSDASCFGAVMGSDIQTVSQTKSNLPDILHPLTQIRHIYFLSHTHQNLNKYIAALPGQGYDDLCCQVSEGTDMLLLKSTELRFKSTAFSLGLCTLSYNLQCVFAYI